MDNIKELMDFVGEKLDGVANSDAVVGQPIELGGVTIVPISKLGIGLGAGAGVGEGEGEGRGNKGGSGKGSASASAGGAQVRPVAIVAFTEDGVEVLPVAGKMGKLDKLIDKIPGWVEKFEKKFDA